MKAIIWGCCGSLPSPASSATIRRKVRDALWEARDQSFGSPQAVDRYLEGLAHSQTGTYKGNTSCVQITHPGRDVVLCDAGTGIRDFALTVDPLAPTTYHIFISHLHWDHIQGFPFFMPAYQACNRIIFHGFHPEIETVFRKQMGGPWFPVPFEAMQAQIEFDIQPDGSDFKVENLAVRTIRQQHPGDSWGYRFESEGKSVVYSTDSEHGPESREADYPFISFFQKADILIFDGQYTFEQVNNEKRHWGHSDHLTAVELGARAEVRQLVVFHHEPAHSDSDIEAMHAEALEDIEHARQGSQLTPPQPFPEKLILAYDGLCLEA